MHFYIVYAVVVFCFIFIAIKITKEPFIRTNLKTIHLSQPDRLKLLSENCKRYNLQKSGESLRKAISNTAQKTILVNDGVHVSNKIRPSLCAPLKTGSTSWLQFLLKYSTNRTDLNPYHGWRFGEELTRVSAYFNDKEAVIDIKLSRVVTALTHHNGEIFSD